MTKELRLTPKPVFCMRLLLCLMFAISSFAIYAQTVTGTVSNTEGDRLSGVTINVKGTTIGTTTDAEGKFSINVSAKAVLTISSVGYAAQDIAVSGRTAFTITMVRDLRNLDEVVVTALVIKKQARGLGYSTTNVKPDELSVNRTPNLINALEGKVAGLNITSLGTGPGGSSKIRIRGQSSISGNNAPLIVINGVPVDNTTFNDNASSGVKGGGVTADGGDGLSSINPDDIESMSVLKGAPAAAL
jgi:hypothetical protein